MKLLEVYTINMDSFDRSVLVNSTRSRKFATVTALLHPSGVFLNQVGQVSASWTRAIARFGEKQ